MKRRAARVVVFLLLGAIVNIAVTWGCVLFHENAKIESTFSMPEFLPLLDDESVSAVYAWRQFAGDYDGMVWGTRSIGVRRYMSDTCSGRSCIHTALSAGFPTSTLFGSKFEVIGGRVERRNGMLAMNQTRDVELPLRPIWPGFAINTMFYAGLLWVVFLVPGKVRRMVRRRRGFCPACAYDLRGSTSPVCTECGEPVTPATKG